MADKKKLKIVIVDDSDFSRQSIVEILTGADFDVVGQADSAQRAIELSGTVKADLFIIDIVMPDVSGTELTKLLFEKKLCKYVIMMSSLTSEHILIESIAKGAIDFLQKPFSAESLISSVEKTEQLLNSDE